MKITKPRKVSAPVPTEHVEAVQLMRLVHLHESQHPALKRLFHVPNGGLRGKASAGKLKAEGVRAGVPDYLLPTDGYARINGTGPFNRYLGLALELKRRKGGRVSDEQRDWLDWFDDNGWRVAVCNGHEHAWAVICEYLGIRNCLERGA